MRIVIGAVSSHHTFCPGDQYGWFQWVEGLQRLGHEVYFVEQAGAKACVDERGNQCCFAESKIRDLFVQTMEQFGLFSNACLIYEDGMESAGLTIKKLKEILKSTDLLINFSGCI